MSYSAERFQPDISFRKPPGESIHSAPLRRWKDPLGSERLHWNSGQRTYARLGMGEGGCSPKRGEWSLFDCSGIFFLDLIIFKHFIGLFLQRVKNTCHSVEWQGLLKSKLNGLNMDRHSLKQKANIIIQKLFYMNKPRSAMWRFSKCRYLPKYYLLWMQGQHIQWYTLLKTQAGFSHIAFSALSATSHLR